MAFDNFGFDFYLHRGLGWGYLASRDNHSNFRDDPEQHTTQCRKLGFIPE